MCVIGGNSAFLIIFATNKCDGFLTKRRVNVDCDSLANWLIDN